MGKATKAVKARVENVDHAGNKIGTVLFEDGSTACDCDGYQTTGTCSHIKAAVPQWVSEGKFGPVTQGAPAAAQAQQAEPAKSAELKWRPASEDEAKRFKYVAKDKLPANVRKIPTDQTEVGKDGKSFPVMRVEIFEGAEPAAAPAAGTPGGGNGAPLARREAGTLTLEDIRKITSSDFYDVGKGRRVPSARVWNTWALDQAVSTELIRDKDGHPVSGCDSEKAWAAVRGRHGNVTREASVTVYWRHEWDQLVWDHVDRASQEAAKHGRAYERGVAWDMVDGRPTVKSTEEQIKLVRTFLRLRRFGERIAVTKAEAIVQRKLLGIEWRDEDEIAAEGREVADVQALRSEREPQAEPRPDPTPAAQDVAGLFPQEAA